MLLVDVVMKTYAVHIGFGKHQDDVGDKEFFMLMQFNMIATVFSLLGAAWSKTSFAITLLRLTTTSYLKHLIWIIIITLNLTLTFNAIMPFIQCTPIERGWNPFIEGTCWDRNTTLVYAIFAAAYSAAMDFILAFIPWAIIGKLQMRTKEKLGVAICMSLGLV